jgi:hypothetical protein
MPFPITIHGTTITSRSPRSPSIWPAFPGIPIYLEANDERATAKSYGTTPTTPTTPEISGYNKSAYLSPAHANIPASSPTDPSPTTTIQTSSDHSAMWPIPEPPPQVVQPPHRRPLLRFFPTDRPRVRLDERPVDTPASTHTPEKLSLDPGLKPGLGLGIRDGPPKPPSIFVQPPPFDNEKGEAVKGEPSSNIAQRIEEKLWSYSASGNVVERWLLEIVSWLISAVCMGGIVAALVVLQDQPVSKWPFSGVGLTLNAFVSILSRVAGAALLLPVAEALGQLKWIWFIRGDSKKMWDFEMFDNASRGPWGALLLLIHTKGRTVAALGALVTIFALALDPFFQQVVSFPERWTLQPTNSSISRAVRYEPEFSVEFQNGIEIISADSDLQAVADPFFIDNGTQPMRYGNGSRVEFPLSCPSSNCTWPTYETLGMCSKCIETPTLLNFSCIYTRVDWTSKLNATISSYPNATVCGYFLNATSSAPVLMSGYMLGKDEKPTGEALLMRSLPLVTNGMREPLWGSGSINFKNIRNPIMDVLIASSAGTHEVHENKPPVLHECVLAWCVKTIRSSYFLGAYEEEIVRTYLNESQGPYPWSVTFLPADEVYLATYSENVTISAPSTGRKFSKWGWGVSNDTLFTTVNIFDRMFPAFTTVSNSTGTQIFRWRTGAVTQVRTKILDINPWMLPNNITNHVERLTEAVTNMIRSSKSRELVFGQAFDNESYVAVRWAWMTLPLALLLISFVFLLATIIKSAAEKDQVSIRKNSAIATLLYGFPDHYQKRLAKSTSKGTPRTKAKELRVRLSPTRGWRASGLPFTPLTPKVPKKMPPPGWF